MLSFTPFSPLLPRMARPATPSLDPLRQSQPYRLFPRPQMHACAHTAAESEPTVRYQDNGTRVIPVDIFIRGTAAEKVAGVYGVMDEDRDLTFVSLSRDVAKSLHLHWQTHGEDLVDYVKVMTFAVPSAPDMKLVVQTWIQDYGHIPIGNREKWAEADTDMEGVLRSVERAIIDAPATIVSPFETTEVGTMEAAELLELTEENLEIVLNEVRPYLISDGGNISILDINHSEKRVDLQLEGACGSCSSSAMTMQLGVEKALRAKFGHNLGEVTAVSAPDPTSGEVTPERCEEVLDEVRDALRGLGACLKVVEVDEDEVIIEFTGPNNLKYGVELLIRQRLPVILTVTFEDPVDVVT